MSFTTSKTNVLALASTLLTLSTPAQSLPWFAADDAAPPPPPTAPQFSSANTATGAPPIPSGGTGIPSAPKPNAGHHWTLKASNPNGPVDGMDVVARGGNFYLNTPSASSCLSGVDANCPNGSPETIITLDSKGMPSLYTDPNLPQEIYINATTIGAEQNALTFSSAPPNGPIIERGFNIDSTTKTFQSFNLPDPTDPKTDAITENTWLACYQPPDPLPAGAAPPNPWGSDAPASSSVSVEAAPAATGVPNERKVKRDTPSAPFKIYAVVEGTNNPVAGPQVPYCHGIEIKAEKYLGVGRSVSVSYA